MINENGGFARQKRIPGITPRFFRGEAEQGCFQSLTIADCRNLGVTGDQSGRGLFDESETLVVEDKEVPL
jgi:hypothetical protein